MNVIEKIKETQQAGALICPRCGRMSMDKALRDFGRIPLPIEEWVIPQMWKKSVK